MPCEPSDSSPALRVGDVEIDVWTSDQDVYWSLNGGLAEKLPIEAALALAGSIVMAVAGQ